MAAITKRANGTITARVRRRGQQISRTFTSRADAKAWADDVERTMKLGATTASGQRERMADIIDRFVADIEAGDAKDKRNPVRLAKWWRSRIGEMQLGDVGAAALRRHLRDVEHRAPATVNHKIVSISTIFQFAIAEGSTGVNPATLLRRAKARKSIGRALTTDECKALIVAADATNPMIATIIRVALATAARQGEILKLRRRDVDLDQRVLRLRDTKNTLDRTVAIPPSVVAALRAHLRVRDLTDDRVFPEPLGRIERLWRDARDASGIRGRCRFHDMRHTALTRMADAGATFAELKQVSGHKTSQMIMVYVKSTAPPAALIDRAAIE